MKTPRRRAALGSPSDEAAGPTGPRLRRSARTPSKYRGFISNLR